MKKTGPITMLLTVALLGAAGASAHDDAYLDTVAAPNGGQVRMAGPYHYELVLAREGGQVTSDRDPTGRRVDSPPSPAGSGGPGEVMVEELPVLVYVTDHAGQAVSTAGASGTATLLSSRGKVTATLAPDGDNRMKGAAAYAATPGMKAVVGIALAGQGSEQARFTPK